MRSAQIAEWILSLVMSPDRAAATVGDLIEDAVRPGGLSFWIRVLRTGLAMLWREFSQDPAAMMGLAVRGFLLQCAFLLGFVVFVAVVAAFAAFFAGLIWDPVRSPNPLAVKLAQILGYVAAGAVVPFQAGRWMARRSPGKELAPSVALTILETAITLAMGLVWGPNALQVILSITVYQVVNLPMFAGAALVRRRRLSR